MGLLTGRSFRRRRVLFGVGMFMAASLISTGFATFVISSQSSEEGNGNVQVGEISDKAMEITITNKNNLGSFVLDTKKFDNRGMVRSDGITDENLSITIEGSISNFEYLGGLNVKLAELEQGDTFIDDAVAKGYIDLSDCPFADEEGYNFSSDEIQAIKNASGVFSFTISLKWGSTFNGMNPGFYYDNEYYDNDRWNEITENRFEGTAEEVKATLLDLRRTFYDVPSSVSDEEFFLSQNNYAPKKYKVTISASAN